MKGNCKQLILLNVILIFSLNHAFGQESLPKKIRISRGKCNKICSYNHPFNEIRYKDQIEYNLNLKSYRFRKKGKNKFKEICYDKKSMLSNKKMYSELEKLYEGIEKIPIGAGKYYIFKIELIYYEQELELPSRIRAMEFLHTDIIDEIYPKILLELVEEYENIMHEKGRCN